MAATVLAFESSGGMLRANGKPFRFKGVTWWGAESQQQLPASWHERTFHLRAW